MFVHFRQAPMRPPIAGEDIGALLVPFLVGNHARGNAALGRRALQVADVEHRIGFVVEELNLPAFVGSETKA